jgi:hypothetical protein
VENNLKISTLNLGVALWSWSEQCCIHSIRKNNG